MRRIKVSYELEVRKYDEDEDEIELSAGGLRIVIRYVVATVEWMYESNWGLNLDLLNLKVELDEDAS